VPAATEQPAPEVALHGLYRGDCFDIGDSADSVVPEPCAEWHDGEVLGQVTGTDQARADVACARLFSASVRRQLTDTELQTQNVWAGNGATCAVIRGDHIGPLTGNLDAK
jgi:hypothetical protein